MDLSQLLGHVVNGALGGKRKKIRKAKRWMSSGRGSPLLTTGALVTAAGVVWGLYETWQNQKKQAPGQGPGPGPAGGPVWSGRPASTGPAGAPAAAAAGASASAPGTSAGIPPPPALDPILRVVRLTVAAARADGTLSDRERTTILEDARQAGVEDVVLRELDVPAPLAEIVRGVTDPAQKRELYTLAYTIVRADEGVSHVERIWLAQLAVILGLDAIESARIESDVAAALDATPES